jgi:DNA-binding MarR family transcriptional regulator
VARGTADPVEVSCLATSVRMASRVLARRYDDALRPFGIRTSQFSMLDLLAEEGPMPLGRLAARLAIERTTATRDARLLSARGLVEIVVGSDRRQRVISLTPAGARVVAEAVPAWREVQASVRELLGAELVDRVIDDARRVTRLVA